MSYLAPHFDHDVFMSYAHGRLPGYSAAPLRDWSQNFIDHLKTETFALRPDIGEVAFCDDRSVDPTAALTDDIKVRVVRSGVLLIIMSPAYLLSSWCTDELSWFKAQFMGRRLSPGRVFIVRAVSTNEDGWPDFLKDSRGHRDIGFQFHRETTEIGIEPYGWPDLRSRTEDFNKTFSTLRTTLIGRLEALRVSAQSAVSSVLPTPAQTGRMLYLHAPPGADGVRAEIEDELQSEGYNIAPAVPRANNDTLSAWQAEFNERVRVAGSCAALTLLRPTDDPSFDNEFQVVGIDTLNRVNKIRRDRPLPCAILNQSQTPFNDADYAERSGIPLFDLSTPNWLPEFKVWFEGARA